MLTERDPCRASGKEKVNTKNGAEIEQVLFSPVLSKCGDGKYYNEMNEFGGNCEDDVLDEEGSTELFSELDCSSDGDLATPEGSDEEYVNIVGAIRREKKARAVEIAKFFGGENAKTTEAIPCDLDEQPIENAEQPTENVMDQPGSSSFEKIQQKKKKHAAAVRRYRNLDRNLVDRVATITLRYVPSEEVFHDGLVLPDMITMPPVLEDSEDEGNSNRVISDPVSQYGTNMLYNENWIVPFFVVGMKFVSHIQFKAAIRKYAIARGAGIRRVKSEPGRQSYQCDADGEGTCPWKIWASDDGMGEGFTVKTYVWEHKCLKDYKSKMVSAEYLALHFQAKLKEEPMWSCKEMMIEAFKQMGTFVKYTKCVRAKIKVMEELEGNFKEEYEMCERYAKYIICWSKHALAGIGKEMALLCGQTADFTLEYGKKKPGKWIASIDKPNPSIEKVCSAKHLHGCWKVKCRRR